MEQRRVINPEKPLPTNRESVSFELGYQETEVKKIPLGKCSLLQAIKFISDHQQNPNEWTAERVANDLKLKQENVENILEHFRMFAVRLPDVKDTSKIKKYLIDPFDEKSSNFDKVLAESRSKKVEEKKIE